MHHHTVYVTLGKRLDFMCARQALYQLGHIQCLYALFTHLLERGMHVCLHFAGLVYTKRWAFCVKAALGIKILNIYSPE